MLSQTREGKCVGGRRTKIEKRPKATLLYPGWLFAALTQN